MLTSARTRAQSILGHGPFCEGSAALIVDCPNEPGRCLLVGDNEEPRLLFLFALRNEGTALGGQQKVKLQVDKDTELSDIEALTRLPTGEIIVLPSYSRKSDCDAKASTLLV